MKWHRKGACHHARQHEFNPQNPRDDGLLSLASMYVQSKYVHTTRKENTGKDGTHTHSSLTYDTKGVKGQLLA